MNAFKFTKKEEQEQETKAKLIGFVLSLLLTVLYGGLS